MTTLLRTQLSGEQELAEEIVRRASAKHSAAAEPVARLPHTPALDESPATEVPADSMSERTASRDPELPAIITAERVARFNAEVAAELDSMQAADAMMPPDDLYDPDDPNPPTLIPEEDLLGDLPPMSRIDALEWELWAGADQDESERLMLRLNAPDWVFLPPGADLAAALEPVRPQCESPIAVIELMKAAARLSAWAESIKTAAMASFIRQRKAQATERPRPSELDGSGRPIDPERS